MYLPMLSDVLSFKNELELEEFENFVLSNSSMNFFGDNVGVSTAVEHVEYVLFEDGVLLGVEVVPKATGSNVSSTS